MSNLIPAECFAALQTQLHALRQQNFEISHREKTLRIDLDKAQRELACIQHNRSKAIPSSSSASGLLNVLFRKLKPRSSSLHIKPSSAQPEYSMLIAENESLRSTIRNTNTRAPEKSTTGSRPEYQNLSDDDEKMEELVMSFEISSGPKKKSERSKSTGISQRHANGGEKKGEGKQNETDKTKGELQNVLKIMNDLKCERDRILADYVSALDLLKVLKSYGEERRRFAERVVREKEELCRAHEHSTTQLRNSHHQTIFTLRSGLTAHITALQRELQLASARIRSLESLLDITSESITLPNAKSHPVAASLVPSSENPAV